MRRSQTKGRSGGSPCDPTPALLRCPLTDQIISIDAVTTHVFFYVTQRARYRTVILRINYKHERGRFKKQQQQKKPRNLYLSISLNLYLK